jgi:tetratricopeptide (TPR) repeat protein/predicted Ser/Thr protein kinase
VDSDHTEVFDGRAVDDRTPVFDAPGWSRAFTPSGANPDESAFLKAGSVLGGRYEILQTLGEGGMGAVYKAHDAEVDRIVALKVIRRDLAGSEDVLRRFRQELVLARQITNRNVVRIYDLGIADGVRFITMEFIEGQELADLLRSKGRLPPKEAAEIMLQVCRGLAAAHGEGVVHRDLKPQNVMIDRQGRAAVMDFGIASSIDVAAVASVQTESNDQQAANLTRVGALLGTPRYMSPEQARAEAVDRRSDLFAVGLIFYELIMGELPRGPVTVREILDDRGTKQIRPPAEVDSRIPRALSDIIGRCLKLDPVHRYQSADRIVHDLEIWLGIRKRRQWGWKPLTAMAAGCAAILIAGGYGLDRMLHSRPAAPVAPMTVMIADLSNHTGDAVFNGTLESALKLALEGASFINAYNRARLPDLGLKAISGPLDAAKAQQIAASQGLNVVVTSSIDRRGAGYQLAVKAIQVLTGKSVAGAEQRAAGKDQVLLAVTELGTKVRKALGDATSESAQRLSMETITAESLDAVHEYAIALDVFSTGQIGEAFRHFSQAVKLDPKFGLAYLGMAAASHNLSRQQDAEKYIQLALSHIDRMTERERYRTRGYLYYLHDDNQKCVDEYGTLLVRYPSDTGAYNNIADCLTRLRNIPKAIEEVRRAVTILPKRATYRVNVALYSAYAGDFQTAAREAAATLQLAPTFAFGFLAQAFASLGQGDVEQTAQAYREIAKIRPSMAAAGLADLAVYQGRYGEAVKILEKGAADDIEAHNPDTAADKFAALAHIQVLRGQKAAALAGLNRALDLSKAVKTRFLAARDYVALGEAGKARELAAGLSSELQSEPQAYGKLIEGEMALKKGDGRAAAKSFTEANAILDTWIGRFDLGTAYLALGAFTEADSEFDRCLRRRGEALALFLDEVPTYGYFPTVYYYQGRVREGLKNSGSAESYKMYLSIRGQAGEDPLLADARRRLSQ